jgi:hydroxypyruvate isomerase
MDITRKDALGRLGLLVGSAPLIGVATHEADSATTATPAQGRIRQSVCKWCYGRIPLPEFCVAAKRIGLQSIELLGPKDWPVLKEHGLHCAMPSGAGRGIENGFNNPALHDELVASYTAIIPQVAAAGYDKIICFSGNRNGMDDRVGLEHCATGLRRLMPVARDHGVTLCMELLNSRVDHPDYMCDKSAWGIALVDRVDSERFRLLYDIYHMQIMEGDVIRTIRTYHEYFAHYHTGGVPGRNEIDHTQELNYPAIMRAIAETGYTGYVGQEFIPTRDNPLESLAQGFEICNV